MTHGGQPWAGRPDTSSALPSPANPANPANPFRCPRCGSEQIQSLSLVHESGLSSSRGGIAGVGVAGTGDVGFASGSTFGQSQSALSRRAAPPSRRPTSGIVGLGVLALLLCGWVGSLLDELLVGILIGGAVLAFCLYLKMTGPDVYNATEWPRLMEQWRRTFACGRCGEFFEIEAAQLRRQR